MGEFVLTFTVPGMPQGKARPRVSLKNGKARAYTPQKTRAYEGRVCFFAARELAGDFELLTLPVAVEIIAWYQRPKSHYGTGRNAGVLKPQFENVWPGTVPDLDNVEKAICDSLNGLVWKDDAQVVDMRSRKFYEDELGPRVEVRIEGLGAEHPPSPPQVAAEIFRTIKVIDEGIV